MTQGDFKQWLYRGQRPNWIARMLNRPWAALASWGIASNYLVTLEVTGRKSGRTVSLPVVVAVVDGEWNLYAPQPGQPSSFLHLSVGEKVALLDVCERSVTL